MSGSGVYLVIPAYKAADTLPDVLRRIPDGTHRMVERILVVEDGGEDVSPSTTTELRDRYPKIEVLWHEANKGYGAAQKTGFRRALDLGARVAALLHADGQYAPEKLPELLDPLLRDECDVVLGSRMKVRGDALRGGMPGYKYLANILLTALENAVYGLNLSEYHSGYMLYHRRALEAIPFETLSDRFHFDGEMLLCAGTRRLRIADLPISTHYGEEESHLRPIRYGFEVLGVVLRYLKGHYDAGGPRRRRGGSAPTGAGTGRSAGG